MARSSTLRRAVAREGSQRTGIPAMLRRHRDAAAAILDMVEKRLERASIAAELALLAKALEHAVTVERAATAGLAQYARRMLEREIEVEEDAGDDGRTTKH